MKTLPACLSVLLGLSTCVSACKSGAPPEPESRNREGENGTQAAERAAGTAKPVQTAERERARVLEAAQRKVEAKPVAQVPAAPGDPENGEFTLEEATKGLPAGKSLVATMKTTKGTLTCELWPDKAPITVANFVGLARGLRPWKDTSGEWVKKPLYDGTPFHRVIAGFMIQGGDPLGSGAGGPGYVIPDEIWEGARHDQRGLLCMANRGPNTNGSQFFVMDGAASHLDGGYTIFGKCEPDSVIQAIASVEKRGDRAVDPAKIENVTITRK